MPKSSISDGLPCPQCQSGQTRVIDSRSQRFSDRRMGGLHLDPRIRRRRVCLDCQTRFTTEERYRDMDAREDISITDRLREIVAELETAK